MLGIAFTRASSWGERGGLDLLHTLRVAGAAEVAGVRRDQSIALRPPEATGWTRVMPLS